MSKEGLFITFEGTDGSGKSTQTRLLAARLEEQGWNVLLTREPGGSTGAEEIRSLVLEGLPERWSAETEILLFTAARRDHMEKIILPALAKGKIVICDRFVDSTRMYQGLRRDDLRTAVDTLTELMIERQPDLTILLDIDAHIGHARAKSRNTLEERFEDFGVELQSKMREGFLQLAKEYPDRIRVVDGNQKIEALSENILELIEEIL